MVRSLRIGALIALLAFTASTWGQAQRQDGFIELKEDGKPAVKCKVLKTWKDKDGHTVSEVQPVSGGAVMTIHEPGSSAAGSIKDKLGRTPGQQVVTPTPGKPGFLGRVFGGSSKAEKGKVAQPAPVIRQTTPPPLAAPVTVEPAKVSDLRQSWGAVETTTPSGAPLAGRPSLPVAKRETRDTLDSFAGTSVPAVGTKEAGPPLTPVSAKATLTTLPKPVTPAALPAPGTPAPGTPAPEVPSAPVVLTPATTSAPPLADATVKSVPVAGCTTCQTKAAEKPRCGRDMNCKSCDTCSKPCATCDKGGKACASCERQGLFSTLGTGERVVKEQKPYFPKERVVKEQVVKERVVKERVVKERVVSGPSVPLVSSLPTNEGRIGVFSGLRSPAPAARDVASTKRRTDLPAGMGSVGAANSARVASGTLMGTVVRLPDGTTQMVPAGQAPPGVPSISVAASNAFTMTQSSSIPYVTMTPDQAANAFGMETPSLPVPADMGSYPQIPNAFLAQGMGGAQYLPPMGHYPPQMGYYPAQPMVMPAGVAVASDMHGAPHARELAALRSSLMPSERERAAVALSRSNWKADPQVVPALVMAAQSDPAPMVRVSCLRALGQMKAGGEPVVEAVKTLREDGDARVRQEASQVLPTLMKP